VELQGVREVASGLKFPEGPVALADGSVLVTEMRRGTLSRVHPDGRVEVVAETGGGPNGAAIGPDGAAYVCNNGGYPPAYPGRIQRVDLATGAVDSLVETGGGERLRAPNDIVFDERGGFWFTDSGGRGRRKIVPGGIYYVPPGATDANEVVFPVDRPNGIGLSPDGGTLYWSETPTRRVMRRAVPAPGELTPTTGIDAFAVLQKESIDDWVLLAGLPGNRQLDSLAVDGDNRVAVATLMDSGITVIAPDGTHELLRLPEPFADRLPTNLCFGGPDLRTAFITLSETGRLVRADWPGPGLQLAYNA
jgi:gluconolactonase